MTTPYYADNEVILYHGRCEEVLKELPDGSVDAVVTDPPYELGFMGKGWDATGIAYDVDMWRQALRVLKPGGHLLAFGGSRTWHRLAAAVEDAGFEIRDSIAWLYGSGFPKSLDVSKAFDKARDDNPERRAVGVWLRAQREEAGMTQKEIAAHWPSATGGLTGCVANWELGLNCPKWDQWLKLRELIGFGDEMDAEVWRLNGRKGTPGEAWDQRPITQAEVRPLVSGEHITFDQRSSTERERRDIPATEAAQQWHGWGTALKPAFEPIVVGRKPFPGTVAGNVQEHGTGALNIDACRIEGPAGNGHWTHKREIGDGNIYGGGGRTEQDFGNVNPNGGRWPTNVALDESQAAELDRQTGTLTSGYMKPETDRKTRQGDAYGQFAARTATETYGDSGGASRFFPTFHYEAKAPTSERPRDGEIAHPTVKPLDLMCWLVRLVTPPGGTVLEPFAGSGTTAEACVIENFKCIAIEREADYLPLIVQRLSKPIQVGFDFDGAA